ncbi:MAG: hypothetical protein HYV93_08165 [Candidatus Rokubacteria bacterium]|nr:hypothetical protein [Candidatus Rokubacteria bacterium]
MFTTMGVPRQERPRRFDGGAMGWVIVEFPGSREVFVDDKTQGSNRDVDGYYRTLLVEDGLHTFRLSGTDVAPPFQDARVKNTGILHPLRVVFTQV